MVNYLSGADYVVIYWDLPEEFKSGNFYKVKRDGAVIAETECCHYKVDGLKPCGSYKFEVEMQGETCVAVGECVCTTEAEKRRIDVTKPPYNALGDGKTLNTKSIQAAIDDCGSGECVYIPEGDFMTGSLYLHSDTELYIEKGAILHGTTAVSDYEPKIKSRFEGREMMCYASLINLGEINSDRSINCENVRITGGGTICGGGRELAEKVIETESVLLKSCSKEEIEACELPRTIPGRVRPRLINVSCAKNVVISGITIMNGPSWNVHMIYSENIVTYGCTFRSENVWNGDGWGPDSSSNCTVFGCEFFTGDDAIAVKSGKNPEGNIINRPCEHIRIFDCTSRFGHGITIGSEMSGGVNDVRIWNCDVGDSVYGIEIKATEKRGGYVRNVKVKNCRICRVLVHSVGYNDDGEAAPEMPYFEDFDFEDITITARIKTKDNTEEECNAVELCGFGAPGHHIKNVRFKNITVCGGRTQNIRLERCDGVSFENIICR